MDCDGTRGGAADCDDEGAESGGASELGTLGVVLSVVALVASVLLVVFMPGTFAFWVAPILMLVALLNLGFQRLDPWSALPSWRRRGAWAVALVSAAAAQPLLLFSPTERRYLLAGLLVIPIVVVLVVRADDDPRKGAGHIGDPALDLPDLPGG